VIVEDHAIVAEGLASVLATKSDMHVVAVHASGEAALDALERDDPQLVLLDVRLPRMDGLATLGALRQRRPKIRVLMLSSHEGDEAIYRAMEGGAVGYVLKRQPSPELVDAIRRGVTGKAPLAPEVATRLASRLGAGQISPREAEILRLIANGHSNKRIADELAISHNTVKNHIVSIMTKLGADDRTQAVTIALQRGIIDFD
jgi:DNA-binding NarL/FixJ family response regulator